MKRYLISLLILCLLSFEIVACADNDWVEADFAFYDADMNIIKKPVASDESFSGNISLKKGEVGQTFRGVKVGDYPDILISAYDLSDAEWLLYYFGDDDGRALINKWEEEGKTCTDVISMNDFLCSKGFFYNIEIDVFKFNGLFVTKSALPDSDKMVAMIRKQSIDMYLRQPDNTKTEEELGAEFDEWLAEGGDSALAYCQEMYKRQYRRAHISFHIDKGVISNIYIDDYYYDGLNDAYNIDGTVNEYYAYILDLK